MSLRPGELLIGDHNWLEFVEEPVVAGERKGFGLIPRNFATHPPGYYESVQVVDVPLIPRSEWAERIRDKVAQKSQLSDLRLSGADGPAFPSLDQGQVGYCWAHSSTHAVMYLRLVMGAPVVPLSAYSVAATIKHGADEGGWGAQSLDFIAQRGVCSQALWPQGDRNYRQYDKPEVWANAALHKVAEGWIDLAAAQYDRTLSFDQECSLLLVNVPVVKDENYWSHSIMGADVVDGSAQRSVTRASSGKLATRAEFESMWGLNDPVTAGFGVRIQNSWGDSWSDRGMGVLSGSKAVSDGAVAPRATIPSVT